jgi:hypothetical protein
MEIVIGGILFLVLVVGVILLVVVNRRNTKHVTAATTVTAPDPDCCGAHEVCELDLVKMNPDIIEYFDDEELDNYKNMNENEFSDVQIDHFREVLYTLHKNEIMNWLLSLSRRNIALPVILQEEARQLIAE